MAETGRSRKQWVMLLLAAIVVVAGVAWQVFLPSARDTASTGDKLHDLYAALQANPGSIHGNWLRTLNPAVQNVQGDLVWNSEQQRGVIRISDLPNPKQGYVYQLWMYDVKSPSSSPVSAGIYQRGSGKQEIFLPVAPQVAVQTPYKFEMKLTKGTATPQGQILLMMQP